MSGLKGQHIVTITAAQTPIWEKAIAKAVQASIDSTPDGPEVLAAFRAEVKKIRGGM